MVPIGSLGDHSSAARLYHSLRNKTPPRVRNGLVPALRNSVPKIQRARSVSRSLHNNCAGHLRVYRAEVGIGACLAKCVRKLLVCVHHLGLEHTVVLTAVCGMSSCLVHVTVVPTATV